jgi:hypothetical protein
MQITSITTNDNCFARQLYRDEAECLPYASAARYLIGKYVSAYWKNDPTDLDFVFMELTLCRYIMMETTSTLSRNLKLKWLSRILEVNPIFLHNDPDLPF